MLSMPRIVRPDPHRFRHARNLGPPLNRLLADPLSETKNCQNIWLSRITVKPGIGEKELASKRARNGQSHPIAMAELIEDIVLDASAGVHRPRNLDWKRAGALLYGDWGTSKAYVIGLAFVAAGFSSLPIILAVCALTGLVGINYAVICRHFPDGGGVYSAARSQGRLLAVVGALLLIADLTVTAALSGWSGLTYIIAGAEDIFWLKFLKDHIAFTTIGVLLFLGFINWFGPKHSGSLAVALAAPTVIVVVALIA